jgi:hypothetical protein
MIRKNPDQKSDPVLLTKIYNDFCKKGRCDECSFGPWNLTKTVNGKPFGWCNLFNIEQERPSCNLPTVV